MSNLELRVWVLRGVDQRIYLFLPQGGQGLQPGHICIYMYVHEVINDCYTLLQCIAIHGMLYMLHQLHQLMHFAKCNAYA